MIYTSAMAGNGAAMCCASLLLNNTDIEAQIPIRYFLVLLSLSQSNHAAQILHNRWPAHYEVVQKLIRLNPSAFEKSKSQIAVNSSPYMLETLTYFGNEQVLKTSLSFRQMLDLGLVQDVREVLECDVAPTDFDESVAGLLHGLSNLPDTEAAPIAPKAYQKGAKLSFLGVAESSVAASDMFKEKLPMPKMLSPLSAAIRRGKSELALAILRLHVDHEDEPIVDFDEAFTLSCLYLQHDIAALLLGLYYDSPHMCHESQRHGTREASIARL
ncbi:hypothetical protein HD806DRAFT_510919 [Xylariaceae sp. AK1471]|nr:hypothetical protein HD806DRAFT_510919 [Xylariaceae sp. AK1471]